MPTNNILTSQNKSFRMFRLLDKSDNYFERNMKLKKTIGTCFMPLSKSREELGDITKKLFGYKGYQYYFPNYVFNYKFTYQTSLVPGRKQIYQNRVKIMRSEAQYALPNLRTVPTFKILNSKNAILDYTDQFKVMSPTQSMMSKQPVLKYAETIYPELIVRMGISNEKPEILKWTSRYLSTQPKPYLSSNFSSIIISISVDVTETRLVNMFIDYQKNLQIGIKRDVNKLKFVSIMRAVFRGFVGDFDDIASEEYKYFLQELANHNVYFVFHNKRFGFVVNYEELRARKVNSKQFRNLFKARLISLISNNVGIAADDSIDKEIEENDELDKLETTNVEQNVDITVNKDTHMVEEVKKDDPIPSNNDIKDDTEEKRDKEIAKLIRQNIKREKETKATAIDVKNKTDKVLSMIDSLSDNENIKLFEEMAEAIDKKDQPIEDQITEIKEKEQAIPKTKVITRSKVSGVNVLGSKETIKVNSLVIDDSDDEKVIEEEEEQEESKETQYDDDGFVVNQDETETPIDPEMEDDIPEDIIEENKKVKITVSSDGQITEEEKKQLLEDIYKQNQPRKSDKQMRRIAVAREKYKSIKTKDDRSLEDILEDVKASQIETVPREVPTVIDKSMENCKLQDFEKSYLKNTMQKDIITTLKSFDNEDKSLPMHIIEYNEEDTSDRFNRKKTIKTVFEDDEQKRHTIKFDIPVPDKDGCIVLNGNKKILKKQITLRPLIKINPSRLAINTFYNKVLMFRQGTVLNRKVVLLKKLIDSVLVEHENTFKFYYGNNTIPNKEFITSIEYDEIAKVYHKFLIGKRGERTVIFFNQKEIREEIKKLNCVYTFDVNHLPIGIDYTDNSVIDLDMKDLNRSVIDLILDVIYKKSYYSELYAVAQKVKAPKRRVFSRITIQSFDVPTITFLSALFGLSNIIRLSGLKYLFTSESLGKDAVEKSWLSIKFKDGTLYYPEYPYANSLLFNGLAEMVTEDYYFDQFDEPVPYMDYCGTVLKTRNVYKGWFAFKDLFIDDITRQILRDEGIPTDFLELFLYANDMLIDNFCEKETDAAPYRIRSYELFSVALYKSIAEEYRKYIQKSGKTNATISIDQGAIIKKLVESQILETYDTINPVNELKMKCGCSVKGNGLSGANTKHGYGIDRRAFGEDAIGIYSSSNVDNHNVGIVKELTTDLKIINTRGYLDTTKDPKKIEKLTASQRMSPDELIMPAICKYDHPNRVSFSGAQWKHTMPIEGGGDPPLIGSGFEKTMVYSIGDTFSVKAEEPGTVVEVNEENKRIVIELKDGSKKVYNYETEYTKNGNILLEKNMELNVKVGQKVKTNEILAFSKEFFKKTAGGDITFTMGRICKIALMDDYFTEEDSSLVSEHLSKKMASSITHSKTITISGRANIVKYTKLGEHVKDGNPIMLFEDEIDDSLNNNDLNTVLDMLGDVDEETLAKIKYHAPKANGSGEITKIDVYWTGEFEDMSDSVRKFINECIKDKKTKAKYEKEQTGQESEINLQFKKVTPVYGKVNGIEVPDEENSVIIEYYITHTLPYGAGDKLSFYPAIKSVTAQIIPEELCPYGESGKIDTVMGLVSLSARQVNSPYFLGACGKVLLDVSKQIAAEYLGKK